MSQKLLLKVMRRIIWIFLLILSVPGPSFAQNNLEAMRSLTVYAMMDYGQKLYDRGDYNGARAVFDHVLDYDSHQAQALKLLKAMGHAPVIRIKSVKRSSAPLNNRVLIRRFDGPVLGVVDLSDTQSLKMAIEAKKKNIETLRRQIQQLRKNLDS